MNVPIPAPAVTEPPAPKWCGLVLRCSCGNKLTAWNTVQLLDQKAIQCLVCRTVIDGKAMENAA